MITNFTTLAASSLRRDALTILEAGLEAVATGPAVKRVVRLKRHHLKIGAKSYNLRKYKHVYIIGIGKAALNAATALEEILGEVITDGVVLDIRAGNLKYMRSLAGTHPLPSHTNMQATQEIITLLEKASNDDLVIAIISGGGSALLCQPYDLECEELAAITNALFQAGAAIQEINTARKHLSRIQGGQLVKLAHPAHIIGLIFSDIPGNDLSMVASGPTVMDSTNVNDAARILAKYAVLNVCQIEGCNLTETPKDEKMFSWVHNELIVSNETAAHAMVHTASKLGYRARLHSTTMSGEARDVGKYLASRAKPGHALIAAGETTVTVKGHGQGGRNLEVALGALPHPPENMLITSLASDGIDNCPAAGALADAETIRKSKESNLDPAPYLADNNAYEFFRATNDLILTGPTGRNVSDLMLVLSSR